MYRFEKREMSSLKCLLDTFGEDSTGSRTIVVQGLPERVQAEGLQNYLEVITKQRIQAVHVEIENGEVAVAVLEEQAPDESIRIWQERAGNRKFEGLVPTLKLLGEPKGIYLEFPKDTTISEEFLSLYFESRKSGGIEETVTEAKLSESALSVHAVVLISSEDAIKSIVRKRGHTFKGVHVSLQPYYSNIHDIIISAAMNKSQPYELPTIHRPKSEVSPRVATVMPVQRTVDKQYSIDRTREDEQIKKPADISPDRYDKNVEENKNLLKTAEVLSPAVKIEISDDDENTECCGGGEDLKETEEEIITFTNNKPWDRGASSSELDMPEHQWADKPRDRVAPSSKSDIPEHQWTGRHFKRGKGRLLQGAMNEDEAFKQAIANSLKDQDTNEDRQLPKTPSSKNTQKFTEDRKETRQVAEPKTTSVTMNHINVSLMQGKIAEQKADVLVNVVSPTGSITNGVISKSFLQLGGDSFKQMCQNTLDIAVGPGTVVRTGASGGMRCKAVLHVTLQPGAENCNQILGKVLPEILDKCCGNGYSTLALPPLGVGRMYKYQAKDVAQRILQGISKYQPGISGKSLKQITVVIFNDDDETYRDFDDAFTSFASVQRKHNLKSRAGDRHSFHNSRPIGRGRSDSKSRHTHGSADRDASGRKCQEGLPYNDKDILKGLVEKTAKAASQNISRLLLGENDDHETRRKKREDVLLGENGDHETRRKKPEDVKRGTKDFAEMMYEKEPVVPAYWDMYKPKTSFKEHLLSLKDRVTRRKHKKISLPQDSRPYSEIIKMINATFDRSKLGQGSDAVGLDKFHYTKLFVVKVERIENLELYEKFARQIQIYYRRLSLEGKGRFPKISELPDCHGAVKTEKIVRSTFDVNVHKELNEVFLFHGTKKENVEVICESGLDNRLAGDKAMFGQGIYGAECSMKADQYADGKTKRTAGQGEEKKMFLVRMLLGNAFVCKDPNPHKYRRPPCTKCLKDDCINTKHASKFGHLFDSIIGDNGKLFREFVVYDSNQCYPEYLITYERR